VRYRLRTLLIVSAVLPQLLWFGWMKYSAWRAEQERLRALATQQGTLLIVVDSESDLVVDLSEPPVDLQIPPQPKAPAKAGE